MGATAFRKMTTSRWLSITALLLTMWVPSFWSEFISNTYTLRWLAGFIIPACLVSTFILSIRWKSIVPGVLLLANPLTLTFSFGVEEWFSKRPSIAGRGLPTPDACNLDPESRCYHASGGCVVVGGEWVF